MANLQRWYAGYKTKKKPQELIETISRKVQEYELSSYIPLLRLEKGARPRKEYYFFLAIESKEKGEFPLKVEDSPLLKLSLFKRKADNQVHSFDYEQIKPMVGKGHQVEDFVIVIPYRGKDKLILDDPFDLEQSTNFFNKKTIDTIENNDQTYQKLMYWLSSSINGSYQLFQKTCQTLGLEEPKRILRRLKLLGNLELSSDGKKWSVTPTALVQVNSEYHQPTCFLCGQQNGKLLKEIEKFATVNFLEQPDSSAPPCIRLQFGSFEDQLTLIETIKESFNLTVHRVGNVAKKLADILLTVEGWKQQLQSLPGIVPSLYDWKYFDGNGFIECTLPQKSGMYQMWDRENNSSTASERPRRTLFYDAEEDSWQQGDWYGLRFLALYYLGQKLIARYDNTTSRLAIPWIQRWPEIYERALVLASGLLPSYQKTDQNNLWLIYENIGQDLAEQITQKLHVQLEEANN